MKPTQVRELFANIKTTFVSFFSILMFVALGVGIFVGISWSSPALRNAADKAFDRNDLYDFQIAYPYGLTEDDLAQLASVEGVSSVEGLRQSFQTCTLAGDDYNVKVQSIGSADNAFDVVEGSLPKHPGEAAILACTAEKLNVGVGDTLQFVPDGDDGGQMKYLNSGSYRITAVVQSSEYVAFSQIALGYSPEGAIDAIVWVLPDDFNAESFADAYPVVNVRCDSLSNLNTFSKKYKQQSAEIGERITVLGAQLSQARYDSIHDDAQERIDEGQAQIDEGQAKVDEGQEQVGEGEQTLAQKAEELEQARQKLEEGQAELESARAQISQAENDLIASYDELSSLQASYDEAVAGIEQARAVLNNLSDNVAAEREYQAQIKNEIETLDAMLEAGEITQEEHDLQVQALEEDLAKSDARIDDACSQAASEYEAATGEKFPFSISHENCDYYIPLAMSALDEAYDTPVDVNGQQMTLNEAKAKLDSGWQQYNDGVAKLEQARVEYEQGVQEFEDGKARYLEGVSQLEEGQAELEDAKEEISEGQATIEEESATLDEAKTALGDMKSYNWTVQSRLDNGGKIEVSTFSDVTTRLSISMAALFMIVGLLVSYSAVSRIVHEQVTQIGTKKALGLRSREITMSFLLYSGIAVIAGVIVGIILGFFLVEGIIGGVLGGRFIMGHYPSHFGWPLTLGVGGLELVLVLGATWIACRGILRRQAVDLLRGEEPPRAKTRFYEKWGIWDKLSLFIQTIVNNCVNDKRRVFSTVVGVAGCTALIVTAITLNDDVMASYKRHYNRVYNYDAIVKVDPSVEGSVDDADAVLRGNGALTTPVRKQGGFLTTADGSSAAVSIIVTNDPESFGNLYHVNPIKGSQGDLSGDGVWVTRAMAKHAGAKIGDTLSIDVGDGQLHDVTIAGFYEFYLTYNEIVMSSQTYQNAFGAAFEPNALLVNTNGASAESVKSSLADVSGVKSLEEDQANQKKNFNDFSVVSRAVVIIYLVLAVLMAIVVLLNLNVMFIDEKKRELIVLMINGFSVKDAKRYIYNDSIVLTALGIILGLVVGGIMGSITVWSIEPDAGSFFKGIDAVAMIVGILCSVALAIIMGWIALRRIPRFDLTDINRF